MLGVISDVFLYAYAQKWYTSIPRSLNHSHQLAQLAKLIENEPFDRYPSHFEFLAGCRDMCDLDAEAGREGTGRRISYLPTLPSSIVVVSNALPLRCLREDMASD